MKDGIQAKASAGRRVVLAGIFLNLLLSFGKITVLNDVRHPFNEYLGEFS